MKQLVNILHISDIHFGVEPIKDKVEQTAIAQRTITLRALNDVFNSLKNTQHHPDIIAISGDVGWKGKYQDYNASESWILGLLHTFNLKPERLVMAPGNHDLDRDETVGLKPPTSTKEADEWLRVERYRNHVRPFSEYANFCERLSIPYYNIGTASSYLSGVREIMGIRFVAINTAWFSRGDSDNGHLWIGYPQIQVMEAGGQLTKVGQAEGEIITVSLFHHPNTELNHAENNSVGDRPSVFNYFAQRCHVGLCGHTHGAVEEPNTFAESMQVFNSGATYSGNDYRNNFSLFQIDLIEKKLTRIAYEYDPRVPEWKKHSEKEYNLKKKKLEVSELTEKNNPEQCSKIDLLIKASIKYLENYIEQKYFAIVNKGSSARIINRSVFLHNYGEKIGKIFDRSNHEGNHPQNHKLTKVELSEVYLIGRPTFLFGEMGSGKSTLVAKYLYDIGSGNKSIPILVPARFFNDKEFDTVKRFIDVISVYINENITVGQNTIDLVELLNQNHDIMLAIDGFDEISREAAKNLLSYAERSIGFWGSLQVISTGRPIELQGLNYAAWQCLEMTDLSREEQGELLYNEALADGLQFDDAQKDVNDRLAVIYSNPELITISNTPLTVRLIRPYLTKGVSQKSLGDLLYSVLHEKLGNWNIKENKETYLKGFREIFPNSLSREELLGLVAAEIYKSPSKKINRTTLYTLIHSSLSCANRNIVATQACEFFEKNILQLVGEDLFFPSQPIFQCSVGLYIFECISKGMPVELQGATELYWRELSFAGSIARQKNQAKTHIQFFNERITELTEKGLSAASSIIAAEISEIETALVFLESLRTKGFRKITYFHDMKDQSMLAHAKCLHLAGEDGFDWFYEEYLDPKYPTTIADFGIIKSIFEYWLLLSNFTLTAKQETKLSKLIQPNLIAGGIGCYEILPSLAIALPHKFTSKQRNLLYVDTLRQIGPLKDKARFLLKNEFNGGNAPDVLNSLEVACSKDIKSTDVAMLWAELCIDRPTRYILQALFYGCVGPHSETILEVLNNRFDENMFSRITRWFLLNEGPLSVAASLKLYRAGSRSFYLIGKGLLYGIEHFTYSNEAEDALSSILKEQGADGLIWLANNISTDSFMGINEKCLRIALRELLASQEVFIGILYMLVKGINKEYTLARYPDIRLALQSLLTERIEYKEALEEALYDIDRGLRYNAACILLMAFPDSQAQAAEIVACSSVVTLSDRHEWNRFCPGLALGVKVKEHLYSIRNNVHPVAKVFILFLLFHNGYILKEEDLNDLISGLLEYSVDFDTYIFKEDEYPIIRSIDQAYPLLLKFLHSSNLNIRDGAVSALWNYHRQRLSKPELARCCALVCRKSVFWSVKILEQLSLLFNDPSFTSDVLRETEQIKKDTCEEPILGIYLNAKSDTSKWKDLLWAAIFKDENNIHGAEDTLYWFIEMGKKDPQIGSALGQAATEFLNNPQVEIGQTHSSSIGVLTLLADEFSTINQEKIVEVISGLSSGGEQLQSALISRLEDVSSVKVPERDRKKRYIVFSDIPRSEPNYVPSQAIYTVLNDSKTTHPELFAVLEDLIISSQNINDDELQKIGTYSKTGALVKSIIDFCNCNLTSFKELIINIGCIESQYRENQQLINYIYDMIDVTTAMDELKEAFLFNLRDNILQNKGERLPLYRVAFKYLSDIQDTTLIITFLNDATARSYYFDESIVYELSRYLINVGGEEREALLSNLKQNAKTLLSDKDRLNNRTCLQLNFFALAIFVLKGEWDKDAEKLFLLGLSEGLIANREHRYRNGDVETQSFHLKETFRNVYLLTDKVAPSIIRQCILNGMESNTPEIRACCKLLNEIKK